MASMVLTPSCDLLDTKPLSDYSESTISEKDGPKYTTKEQIEGLLNGAYDGFYDWYYEVLYFELGDIQSDNAYNGTNDLPERQMQQYKVTPLNEAVGTTWSSLYGMIRNANVILSNIDAITDAKLTPELKKQYIAQAKGLRAWAYFDLARIYGDVPLITAEIPDVDADNLEELKPLIYPSRNSVEEVYAQIVEDLGVAATDAPDAAVGTCFVVNKAVANALLAKVHATIEPRDWGKVNEYCQRVMDAGYSLLPDYANLWNTGFENNQEIIFSAPHDGVAKENTMWWLVYGGDNRDWPRYDAPSHDLLDVFTDEKDEIRKNATIEFYPVGYQINWPTSGCAFSSKVKTSDQDIIYLRLADILLLKAEALVELNQLSAAAALVDQVRERVELPGLTGTQKASQANMRLAIEKERRLELAMEGHRWHDLKRTNRALEVLGSYKDWNGQTYANAIHADKLLLPLPQTEMDRNSNLTQNKGYK